MNCVACGKTGVAKDFLYDENKKLYCINPFTCNEHHPNSVPNIIARGAAVKMYTESELEMNFFDINGISDEVKERVLKIAAKPQSIRLSKFDMVHYLVELQEKRGLGSLGETVRYCISYTKKYMPIDAADEQLDVPVEESPNEQEQPIAIGGLQGIVVPDVPKSVNVDWNNLPHVEPKKTEPVEEEEWEF